MSRPKRRIPSVVTTLCLGLVVAAVFTVVTSTQHAAAISNVAPDKADYGNNSDARLTLTNTQSTKGVTELQIPIYVSAPKNATGLSTNITLYSPYFAYGQNNTLNAVRVLLQGDSNRCMNSTASNMTVAVSDFAWSEKYGLWYATVSTKLVNKKSGRNPCAGADTASKGPDALIEFKLRIDNYQYTSEGNQYRVTSSGATPEKGGNSWLAYSKPETSNTNAGDYYFATSHRRSGQIESYSIPLATPCDIAGSGEWGALELYDLDTRNSDNGGRPVSVSVRDETTGNTVPGSQVDYDSSSNMGNNKVYRVRLKFLPGHKYRLRVNNIHFWNILKYRLPYDNIAYVTDCPSVINNPALVGPVLSIQPSDIVNDGSSYAVHFATTSDAARNAQVNTTARIWYDANGNDEYDSGESEQLYENDKDYTAPANTVADVSAPSYVADAARGDRICASWRINASRTAGVSVSTTTQVVCIDIVPLITVRILGNDIRVGSGYTLDGSNSSSVIRALIAKPDTSLRGSWGEYGVIAPSGVINFASASGINRASATIDQSSWSRLTFQNSPSYGYYGTAEQMGLVPNVAGYDLNKLSRGGQLIEHTGSLSINTINNFNKTRIYKVAGHVTITGNISYADSAASDSMIPQIVIIADSISIEPGVTRVDAWLVANQEVDTCDGYGFTTDDSTELRKDRCDKPLEINGPVFARDLYLERTYNTPDADPAETINMRSDAYLWSYHQSQGSSYRTSYIRDLPPRY